MTNIIKFDETADPHVFQRLYDLIELWSNDHGQRPATWADLKQRFDDAGIIFSPRDLYDDTDNVHYSDLPLDKPHVTIPHPGDMLPSNGNGRYPFPFFYDEAYVPPVQRNTIIHERFRRNRVAEYSCAKCS